MKAVILAGGLGTRLSEETVNYPKPMVEIGGRPILWHIMKIYAAHGVNDFIICLGYKGHVIKEFFSNYYLHTSDVTFDLRTNQMEIHHTQTEPWRVTLIETGAESGTGGRLRRVAPYLVNEEAFCFTYGDGVGDIDIAAGIAYHRAHGGLATVTGARPPRRFGVMELSHDHVTQFLEKPHGEGGWINAGFFVLSPKVIELIDDDATYWEQEPMRRLAERRSLYVYRHEGYWQPMDTLRDKQVLEELWRDGKAPWRIW